MRIGGFVKQSLIDYPGKIAALVFTKGCNFRCGYCHNPHLVLPHLFNDYDDYPSKEILHYLNTHKNWLDAVVISGGEPTIHYDLPDFLASMKSTGLLVKLDTNGSNPEMLKQIIKDQLVDYIAMDLKTLPEKDPYLQITGNSGTEDISKAILQSVKILNQSSLIVEYRTTWIPGIHNDSMIEQIEKITGSGRLYTLHEYREGQTVEKICMT